MRPVALGLLLMGTLGLAVVTGCKTGGDGGHEAAPAKPEGSADWNSKKLSAEEVKAHAGEPGAVRLSWKSKMEERNKGYNIMRGTDQGGKGFHAINAELILGAGTSSSDHSYEYFDTDVKVGETHFYYLESVDTDGNHKMMTPVQKSQVDHLNPKK